MTTTYMFSIKTYYCISFKYFTCKFLSFPFLNILGWNTTGAGFLKIPFVFVCVYLPSVVVIINNNVFFCILENVYRIAINIKNYIRDRVCL